MVFTGEHHGVVECGRAWQICVYTEQITPISWCKVLILVTYYTFYVLCKTSAYISIRR